MPRDIYLRATRGLVLLPILFGLLLFLPAGTLDYWQGWLFTAVFFLCSLFITVYLALYDPALLARRMRGGPWAEKETAQKIIDQLKAGGDFATLAKRFSGDKSTAQKGGDLGWFPPDAMGNKNFADAIGLLKNNEITSSPIQTQYGWHVLQLLGTRDRPPPSYEGVQDQLKRILLSKKYRAYSDELLKTAKIDPPLAHMPAVAPAAAPATAPAAPAPAAPAGTAPKTN